MTDYNLSVSQDLHPLASKFIATRKLIPENKIFTNLLEKDKKILLADEEVAVGTFTTLRQNKGDFPMFNSLADFYLASDLNTDENKLADNLGLVAYTSWDGLVIQHFSFPEFPFLLVNILGAEKAEGEFTPLKDLALSIVIFELDSKSFDTIMKAVDAEVHSSPEDKAVSRSIACIAACVSKIQKDFPSMVMHENLFKGRTGFIDTAELHQVPAGATIN